MAPRRNPVGRPPKVAAEDIPKLMDDFSEYIRNTDIPIIAQFAAQQGLWKGWFHDRVEFSNLLKECTNKKEAALEIGMLTGTLNATGSIFSLKQLGWTDRQQLDMNIKQQSFEEQLQSLNQAKEIDVIEH